MKKILFGLLYLGTVLTAEIINIPVTIEFVESNKTQIIDIRTQSEWQKLGVVKDAHLITFFDEKSQYDIDAFLEKLNHVVKKDEQFAIISNSSSRTKLVSNLLGHKLDYHVVNLIGGMEKLIKEGYRVEKYLPREQPLSFLAHQNPLNEKIATVEKRVASLNENNSTKELK